MVSDNFRTWTRDEWRTFHRHVRARRWRGWRDEPAGLYLLRDERGLGVTQRHDKGHLIAPAAIVNVLGHAARWRHLPNHHAIYIETIRALRKRGTWL